MRRTELFLILFLVVLPSNVFAHAEEPAAEKIYFLDDQIFVKANFGLASETFAGMVCEEAFVGGSSWKFSLLDQNEWVVLGETNIQKTTDGCEFEPVKDVTDLIIPDMVTSPSRTNIAYIANAGDGEGIWVSTDRGASFQQVNLDTTPLQLTAARFSTDDTLIVSGYSPDEEGAGRLWQIDVPTLGLTDLVLPADVKFPYVLDANANGIAWLGRLDVQTIFWGDLTNISARIFEPPSWPSGAVLSEDAQTLWVAGPEAGLGIARGTANGTWETLLPDQVTSCIQRNGADIYFCGLERRDGADVFRLTSDTEFEPVTQFTDLTGARADCPDSTDVGTVCPIVWNEIASYFGQEQTSEDTGTTAPDDVGTQVDIGGAENDAGSEPSPSLEGGGDCCATTRPRTFTWGLFAFLFLVALRRRRT